MWPRVIDGERAEYVNLAQAAHVRLGESPIYASTEEDAEEIGSERWATVTLAATEGRQHYEDGPIVPEPVRLHYRGEAARRIERALEHLNLR